MTLTSAIVGKRRAKGEGADGSITERAVPLRRKLLRLSSRVKQGHLTIGGNKDLTDGKIQISVGLRRLRR